MSQVDPVPAATAPHRFPRWRRILVGVLVVLSCVLVPLTGTAIWVRNQLLDTSRYVENVTPLASDPAILDAAAAAATKALFDNVDVESQIKSALPPRAQVVAGPLATALRGFAQDAARKLLGSQQFEKVWVAANRRAHSQVEKALTGGGKVVSTKNGKVELDLSAILLNIRAQLDRRGITVFDSIPINKLALKFQLFDASALSSAQQAVKVLNTLAYVLPVLIFVLFGLAIWLSPNRRRTIIRWGIGVAIAAAVLGVAIAVGRSFYLSSVSGPGLPRAALAATWDTLIRFLRGGVRAVIVIGLLVAFVTWVLGPGRTATRVRTTAREVVGGMGDRAESYGWDFGELGRFVHHRRRALQVAGVIVAVLFLVFGNRVSAAKLLWTVVVLLVYLALVLFVARAAKVDEPAALPRDS